MTNIVIGVIGSDAHVVGITLIDHALREAGHDVTNIGVQSSQEEFIEAAQENDADAILVSSLYGHALQDSQGFHEKIERAGIDPVTYIGGNLSVGSDDTDEQVFREMGFDRVFNQSCDVEEIISTLENDLGQNEQEQQSLKA